MSRRLSLLSRGNLLLFTPVASLALFCAAWAGPPRAEDKKADDKLDKKVVDICKKAGDLYKSAKTFHADGEVSAHIENNGQKRDINVTAVFDFEKPNHLAIRVLVKGDPKEGVDIISDGKKMSVYRKSLKQYMQEDAPDDVSGLGMALLKLGPLVPGILLPNVLNDDPGDSLMQGVNSCSYVGMDKVDGTPAHHMKFSQDQFDWEMWVAAEGKPFVLKMTRSVDAGGGGKITASETYKNWTIDAPPAKDAFTFSAPKDASKVDEFKEAN
jgi:hypothetical protein